MKYCLVIILLYSPFLFAQIPSERCGTDHIRAQRLAANPDYTQTKNDLEIFTAQWIKDHPHLNSRNEIRLPVVVHVVWKNEQEQISEEQIRSQITVLNEDFNARNTGIDAIPSEFQRLVADVGIEFCLASVDPDGNAHSGITYTNTDFDDIANFSFSSQGLRRIKHQSTGGANAWDTESYINVWVGKSDQFAGEATFPGEVFPNEDGIVIDYRFFGKTGEAFGNFPFHLGRTLTHEIGHYFNLRHPWGSFQLDCNDDDCVDDTPTQSRIYGNCPTHPQESCASNDLFMNYMNYVVDDCMHLFTHGQKRRMLAALNGPRSGLLNSLGCGQVPEREIPSILSNSYTIYPNPASNILNVYVRNNPIELESLDLLTIDGRSVVVHGCSFLSKGKLHSLDLAAIPKGIYILHIKVSGTSTYEKILIQ